MKKKDSLVAKAVGKGRLLHGDYLPEVRNCFEAALLGVKVGQKLTAFPELRKSQTLTFERSGLK
jgi:hypothetical protein